MVSTCRNNHRLSPIALFSLCIPIVHAWSGPNSSHLQEPIDRRVMVSKVSAVVAGGLAFAGLETASAIDVASSPEDFSFNTYNIIPDASASLDPRLVQVDVSCSS